MSIAGLAFCPGKGGRWILLSIETLPVLALWNFHWWPWPMGIRLELSGRIRRLLLLLKWGPRGIPSYSKWRSLSPSLGGRRMGSPAGSLCLGAAVLVTCETGSSRIKRGQYHSQHPTPKELLTEANSLCPLL